MQEGEKFHTSLAEAVTWLVTMQESVDDLGLVSGEKDTLIEQKRQLEVGHYSWLLDTDLLVVKLERRHRCSGPFLLKKCVGS